MIVTFTTADGAEACIRINRDVTEDRACHLASVALARAGHAGFCIRAVRPT
ncbi:hypothetical protein PBI_OMNICRON_89 [Mycobacterium phage Omnicron]|uniref:Uncharacterized protein n=2 Tax=Kratiovirus TaxID=2948788 RepID=A0A088FRJ1_9CAUD|nr:hypothetical protein PBI_OMNICRON_89 [Mycobacterium phage Omnicron]YP_009950984.1 hypothetical protein I5G75_gp10 [Mycobacterium phage Rando14]AIM50422.1 hypothetical protein PBI_OMNICRON_89 [Mycobacterium phage Omnicron]AXQ53106.1 hypothetical protein SEA_RANDO14_86 [Mycobacterium phage Rando14]